MATDTEHCGVENPSKPFSLIFFIEFWERWGFYGMQAVMVYFMITNLNFDDTKANMTWGAMTALCYAFISVGGFVGDKVLGTKRTMLIGAIVLAIGYLFLTIHPEKFIYIGMGTIVAGNMMFKANPSSLVSKLYKPGDHRIDSAFTMYYMSINLGSFFSMILCPMAQEYWGYSSAFLICVIGLSLAIAGYLFFSKLLAGVGSQPDFEKVAIGKLFAVIVLIVVVAIISSLLLKYLTVAQIILYIAIICIFLIMIKLTIRAEDSKQRMSYVVCMVLIVEAVVFYILYNQMPTSLNLFAIRNTNHDLFGLTINPLQYQTLNPFWIIIGSPILALIYNALGKHGRDFTIATKFAFGMLLCSLGFLALPLAGKFFADSNGIISGNWMVVTYGFQSIGELLIAGLGLSMVTKLVPQKVVGFVMGAWFLATAISGIFGGMVASLASVPKVDAGNTILSLKLYSNLFLQLGISTFIICIIMFIFVPKLNKFIKQ
ncbi:MAG TPA: dipeptide/tripeptide permease [Lentisphaeria bacterium]|nr:MAG: dipeptide/tripeptide permease [Lentisphaerae bacterium GWF2_38_69]HBM15952.1 dipeptide/tripeptide permease [Lentisphaeria bacterium]